MTCNKIAFGKNKQKVILQVSKSTLIYDPSEYCTIIFLSCVVRKVNERTKNTTACFFYKIGNAVSFDSSIRLTTNYCKYASS